MVIELLLRSFQSLKRKKRAVELDDDVEEKMKEDEFVKKFMSLSPDVRRKIGHNFDEDENPFSLSHEGMFISCNYRGENCLKVA